MPFMGGTNTSNYIPKNNIISWSGGTSKPKGKGQGSWVSGSKTSRGNYTPGKRKRGTGGGSRPKKSVNTTPKTTPQAKTPRGLGAGAVAATRGNSLAKVFLSKGGILGLGAYVFFRVLLERLDNYFRATRNKT